MSDELQSKLTDSGLMARTAILDAIKANIAAERLVNLASVGGLANALRNLADTDLYSKGPPDNNYAKNSKRTAFDAGDVIRTADDIRGALKQG